MEIIIANKIFHFFCHQIPERSLQFGGEIFPLCFRCSGIYMGIFISHLTAIVSGRLNRISPDRKIGLILILFTIPFTIDGFGNYFHWWNSSSEIKMITGVLTGIFISITLISIPNLLRKKYATDSNFFLKDLLIPILIGLATIYLFINTNSVLEFEMFVYICLIGWLIVVVNIFSFVFGELGNKIHLSSNNLLYKKK